MQISSLYSSEQERHFNYITLFHVNPCQPSCPKQGCLNQHSDQSPRRVPLLRADGKWNYMPKLCKNLKTCKSGDHCSYAHSRSECSYHPLLYKVNDCKFPSNEIGRCSRWGFDCSFAHEVPDRRTKGLQKGSFERESYKTLKCVKKVCNDPSCLFFHTSIERRRSQLEFSYSSVPCMFTFIDRSFTSPEYCPLKDKCGLAHTKNEVYYHSEVYKTKPCKSSPCYAPFCAFCHGLEATAKEDQGESKERKETVETKETKQVKDCELNQPVIEESVESSDREAKPEVPAKLRCKNCNMREIKWILECGAIVCGKCITNKCIKCGRAHVARIDV